MLHTDRCHFSQTSRKLKKGIISPALVAQGVSARHTGHILEALLPQGELREGAK